MTVHDFDGEIEGMSGLNELIANNPGILVIKLGATWCAPCKKIKDIAQQKMDELKTMFGERAKIIEIDIDDCFEVYATLKTKRIVNGIPAILCWHQDNVTLRPSDFINDSNPNEVALLFERCASHMNDAV
jgi:thiol-disulfide isomerase/thioredoxin